MLTKKSVLATLFLSVTAGSIFAGNFSSQSSYTVGDVLLCFRKSGSGASDLVVDAGPVSTLTNLTANTRYPITAYTGGQLAPVGTNNISWSAFTYFDNSVSSTLTPTNALFATRARSSINTQTSPWTVLGTPAQGSAPNALVGGDMSPIPIGANFIFSCSYRGLSTATAVVEPEDPSGTYYQNGTDYADVIKGNDGLANFKGDFEGVVENTTSASFITSATVSRSDFYEIPVSGKVVYLGYFEFSTNASMTFVAYPSVAVAVPVIKSIGRTNLVTSVNFTTGASGTYTLRGTNSAGLSAARLTWPAISNVAGDGNTHTLTDTTTNSGKFYIITAQ